MAKSDRPCYYIVWIHKPHLNLFREHIGRFDKWTMNEWHYNKVDGYRIKLTKQEASILKLSVPDIVIKRSEKLPHRRFLLPPPEMFKG